MSAAKLAKLKLLKILHEAKRADYGVIVKTSNVTALKARLYPLIKSEPEFAGFSLLISRENPETDIWISNGKWYAETHTTSEGG